MQFVLLTGVTKLSQVSVFSGFNQPDDIGLDERYEALCGITKEELYSTFDEPIKAMAVRYKVSEDEMKYRLKRKFDGYHFSPNMLDIYNPFSILNTLNKKILVDYWFATGITMLATSYLQIKESPASWGMQENFNLRKIELSLSASAPTGVFSPSIFTTYPRCTH